MIGCLDWDHGVSSSTTNSNRDCGICDAPSNGYHFNAPSCSACAAFFRRTVTLNRNFVCSHQGQCRVNFAMRVICRSCRYLKCLRIGMDRSQVQPRRDCNSGRRKIMYQQEVKHHVPVPSAAPYQPTLLPISNPTPVVSNHLSLPIIPNELILPEQAENRTFRYDSHSFQNLGDIQVTPHSMNQNQERQSPEVHYAQSYSSSISEDIPSPKYSLHSIQSKDFAAEQVLEDLLREERRYNERKKLLYCSQSSITKLLSCDEVNDIPYTDADLSPLTFSGIKKQIRPQILVIYEWLRGWRHFEMLDSYDRNVFLRRSVLYHTLLDPCFLTYRLGLPNRYIMFNGMYVGIDDNDKTGWETEDNLITAELKMDLYRPLMKRSLNEICSSMQAIKMTFVEYVIVKALVIFKCTACSDISIPLKKFLNDHMDLILKALNVHYHSIGLCREEIASRTGNVVLMMSGIFAVGMECLESHQKIQFFDLWQLDDLLIKLISRAGSREM